MEKRNQSTMEFDWTPYQDGWNGSSLRVNKQVKTDDKKTKVYSHEAYAQELYYKYTHSTNTEKEQHKDLIIGTTLEVSNITPIIKNNKLTTSVMIDTFGGGSCVIDLNKEREYIHQFGIESPEEFVEAINDAESKAMYLTSEPKIKVLSRDRVSLWDGYLANVEKELFKALDEQNAAYQAKIIGTNKGGFICVVNGVNCFLPGSMASAGVVTDFEALIGKTLPVMVVNYVKGMGFVVSYKKYLSRILPKKIEEELSINQEVSCRVTGTSKNGIFVSFNDKDGEPIFTGLIYRDYMSSDLESEFDKKHIIAGDIFHAHILRFDEVDDEIRINLSDMDVESKEFKDKQLRIQRQREESKKTKREASSSTPTEPVDTDDEPIDSEAGKL
jgi:hypothetical protein